MELHKCEGITLIEEADANRLRTFVIKYAPHNRLLSQLTEELNKSFCCVSIPFTRKIKNPWYLFFLKKKIVVENFTVNVKHFPATYEKKDTTYRGDYNCAIVYMSPIKFIEISICDDNSYYVDGSRTTIQEVKLYIADKISSYIEHVKLGK
jgi:hypothetical protein